MNFSKRVEEKRQNVRIYRALCRFSATSLNYRSAGVRFYSLYDTNIAHYKTLNLLLNHDFGLKTSTLCNIKNIRDVILGPELQCHLKVKEDLN